MPPRVPLMIATLSRYVETRCSGLIRGECGGLALAARLDVNDGELRAAAARLDRHQTVAILRPGDQLNIARPPLSADRTLRAGPSPEVDVTTALGHRAVGPHFSAVVIHDLLRHVIALELRRDDLQVEQRAADVDGGIWRFVAVLQRSRARIHGQ